MKIEEMLLNIKTDFSDTLNTLRDVVNSFTKVQQSTTNVSNSLKKVGDNVSPTTKKLDDLNTTVNKVSDTFQNRLYKAMGLKPNIENQEVYRKELEKTEKEVANLSSIIETFERLKKSHARPDVPADKMVMPTITDNKTGEVYDYSKIDEYKSRLDELKAKQNELNAMKVKPDLSELIKDANDGKHALQILLNDVEKSKGTPAFQSANNALKEFMKQTGYTKKDLQTLGNESDKTGKKIKRAFLGINISGVSSGFKKLRTLLDHLGKNGGNAVDHITRKFKKLGLGLLGVRTAMSLLTKAVGAYMSFDSALQDSVSNSWNMLGSLLAPAIEMVANLFAKATAYVYTFIKSLTGIDLVARANAKAIATQTEKTKKLAQAQRSLTSMDEITNLQTETGGVETPQIEVPQIEPNELFSNLIDLIKKGDWYGVGKELAEGLNRAMESIPWGKIRQTASDIGKNFALFLNGGIENLDWNLVGTTLGQGINTAIDLAYSFVTTFNWRAFGQGIADLINGAFKTIEWDKLAKTISEGIKGILTTINTTLSETDWEEIGNSIRTFIMNIDWVGIGKEIFKALYNGIKSSGNLLDGLFDTKNSKVGQMNKNTLMGPIGGLINAFEEFKKYKEDPEKYAQELETKLNTKLGDTKKKFEDIGNGVNNFKNGVGDFFASIPDKAKSGLEKFSKGAEDMANGFGNFVSDTTDKATRGYADLMNKVEEKINNFKEKVKNVWNDIKQTATNKFKEIFDSIKMKFKEIGSKVGETVAGAFKGVINGILGAIEGILNTPIRAVNSLIKTINKIPGINIGKLKTFNLPRLATGTNDIPKEGIYHLHEGEAVVPKKYNPATGGYDNGADNKQIIDLLFTLNQTMIEIAEKDNNVYLDGRQLAEGLYSPLQNVSKNKNVSSVMIRS